MARTVTKTPPRLPLFDRLLQGDSIETDRSVEAAMRELRDSVRRDLEILFNTRPRHLPLDPELEELQRSVLAFGLSEVQGRQLSTPVQQQQFQRKIETIIRHFEPRFQDLAVELVPASDPLSRTLHLRIHARLEADSISEPVTYDTVIDPISGNLALANRSMP